VCILHGGFAIPDWLAQTGHQLHVTVNDPDDHPYDGLPVGAMVTRNPAPVGFSRNVNAALQRVFAAETSQIACVLNFDVDAETDPLADLTSVLAADDRLGAAGSVLCAPDGSPTFSAGTMPTPTKELLRAAGLRNGAGFRLQRVLLRRTKDWQDRNVAPQSGVRILSSDEYVPWTCLAVRRRAWQTVGELDERFPLYAEDIDWAIRCHRAGWALALVDCGRVVHSERATRGSHTDALYEYSHLELHRKWGWDHNLRWQRRALRVRRHWPLRNVTAPLDWSIVTNLDRPG
jgi:GT2 family glycosyltransferase